MQFYKGDYISGVETVGIDELRHTREMRGWVDTILGNRVLIRADDNYEGNRGTIVDLDTAWKCNRVVGWQKALKRELPIGTIVKHFKGHTYRIDSYPTSVDGGKYVVYSDLRSGQVWVREYSEFMSDVDKEKYPSVNQKHRFEVVEE